MKKLLVLLFLSTVGISHAGNGIIDINATCASSSCFPGDNVSGFPVTITESGTYQLTSNLVSTVTDLNVIEIFVDNVTINLNGFAIIGPKTCTGTGSTLTCTNTTMTSDGIGSVGVNNNIVIKNGSIRGLDAGIILNGLGNKVMNVTVSETDDGIINPNGVIENCIANRNLVGFRSIHNSLVANVLVKDSAANGNKSFSAIARVCSDVFFINNGNGTSTADAACLKYTNESTCQVAAQCP
jgi:hypothetical protein